MTYNSPASRDEALSLDMRDPLASARDAFCLEERLIYLDGHSLGPATKQALQSVERAAGTEWTKGLIRSWNEAGWIDSPVTVGAKLAKLIGAQSDEVIVCDSVSVNLFKLAAAALPLARSQSLLVEADEFPTDQYIAQGLSALNGAEFVRTTDAESLSALRETGGVLIKSLVNYRTAAVADIRAYETAAHEGGGLVIWDLSHATGVLDLRLNENEVRLATGCTYKYLNGGPGAPAFIFAGKEIISQLQTPLSGWFGHGAPFAFEGDYRPLDTAARFAVGTPGILSLQALNGALDAFAGTDLGQLEAKARALGDLCLKRARDLELQTISPENGQLRGGHISLLHEEGYAIVQALIARGIIPDFRAPDAMRFGFSPLYVRFVDVWDAMDALANILQTRAWDKAEFKVQAAVT